MRRGALTTWLLAFAISLTIPIGGIAQQADRDGDRIPDARDQCPSEPETYNGFSDDDGCPDSFDDLFQLVRKDIEEYWQTEMPGLGGRYQAPSVRMYDRFAVTPCADTLGPNNAFFTSCGRGLYFHRGFMEDLFARGDWIPAVVAAHEWGHLAQYTLGMGGTLPAGVFRELHADCYAGAYTRYVEDERSANLRLSPGDVDEALIGLFRIGDTSVPWLNPQHHGTGGDRVDAFDWGYKYDASGCNGSVFLARFGKIVDRRGVAIPDGALAGIFPDPALGPFQLVDCFRLKDRVGKNGEVDAIRCDYESRAGSLISFSLIVKTTAAGAGSLLSSIQRTMEGKGWTQLSSGQIMRSGAAVGASRLIRSGAFDIFMYTNDQLFGYVHGPSDELKRFVDLLLPPTG